MPYTPIVGTLGYVLSRDKTSVLMVHRNARPNDHAYGKYNGLGGKMERDEDVATCMKREIREEAGIEITSMQLRGTVRTGPASYTNAMPRATSHGCRSSAYGSGVIRTSALQPASTCGRVTVTFCRSSSTATRMPFMPSCPTRAASRSAGASR